MLASGDGAEAPGLTFCSLVEPLLMRAELLGGMFSHVEVKHMSAISLRVVVVVVVLLSSLRAFLPKD